MASLSLNSTVIARLAQALYGFKIGNATMAEALAAANAVGVGIDGLANALYARDFGSRTNADVAASVVKNLGITTAAQVTEATAYVKARLDGATAGTKGAVIIDVTNLFSGLTANAAYGSAARAFNADIASATNYGQTFGTLDIDLGGGAFNIDSSTTGVMRLTGNLNARIDLTRATDQVTGLDLNRNGTIQINGVENVNPTKADDGKNFTVVDAYARNPLDATDSTKNYLGDINFDGTGFAGDGVKTNGNIFLGGLGSDIALGGVGNDFLAGGGALVSNPVTGLNTVGFDDLSGGRNADFIFVELSRLSATDGNNERVAGGTTSDDTVAVLGASGGLGTQDNDWILLEASDDDEPVTVNLNEGGTSAAPGGVPLNNIFTASGRTMSNADIESVNASGNLYGFLNSTSAVVGSRSYDGNADAYVAGAENYGRGSTAQLIINGTSVANALIGGYDNDQINGDAGADLLMGGDLRFLITNKNNPNLLDSKGGLNLTATAQGLVNDGKDNLIGGTGNDNIVFEADNGTISGDADTGKTSGKTQTITTGGTATTFGSDDKPYTGPRFQSQGDTVWLTDFSMGRLSGAVLAGEATAQSDALAKLTPDSTFRVDLGGGANFKNYGGTNLTATTNSQDTTNYVGTSRVTMTTMESVNTTGLGALDYKAAGTNSPEVKFNNQQNYNGLAANVDLRGNGADNALLANTGIDTIEGRGGDDVVSGGSGSDRFLMTFGDAVDWNARPVDANADGLWDTTGGLVVASGVAWSQDFRTPAAATAGTTSLVVDFGTTILNGVDTFVATFQVRIDGVDYGAGIPAATLAAAKSTAELATIVNAAYQTIDKSVTVVATSPTTIEVRAVDKTPGDGVLPIVGTTAATGFFVTGQASGAGTYQAKGTILGLSGTNLDDDRLVIKTYEDRSINLGQNEKINEISQAAQMVTSFSTGGSTLSEGQSFRLYLDGVREGDKISVDVNGTKYEYTLLAGENAEAAAVKLAAVINTFLDKNASAGQIGATSSATSGGDGFDDTDTTNLIQDNNTDRALVTISQTFINNSAAFMDITATVTRADGATAFGNVTLHNQTNTEFQILGFDGRNGALTSQDKDSSPVVLFQGRNTGTTSMSVLLTAKDSGGALNGVAAVLDPTAANNGRYINGDDLLIGGNGNDVISGNTGDDRILMSKGTDTVDGGGNTTFTDGTTQIFQDVLQAEERTFGTGTSFKVTLDGALGAAGLGKGTVAAIKSDGTPTGDVTTFTGIELVRALENNRQSELDVKALSDSVALAAAGGPNGGILPTEGLTINLLTSGVANTYTVDLNNDGVLTASETVQITAVVGVENVTTGNANDTINVDESQLGANNKFTMGAQQGNEVTFVEGLDTVNYDYSALTAANRPRQTIAVLAMGSATVAATGGLAGTATFTDTLNGVEQVNVTNAATSSAFADKLDLSALAGATVNYGAAEAVGKSLGGTDVAPVSVATAEADSLQTGGVSLTGVGLGNELLQIGGITLLETVTGSAGSDRVIVANSMQPGAVAAPGVGFENVAKNAVWFSSAAQVGIGAAGAVNAAISVADYGLFSFNLGAGDDSVDYKQETAAVTVVVDTTGTTDADLVFVGVGAAAERADNTTGVERYFGGSGNNYIDVVASAIDTTIQYSKEARSNTVPNDKAEPQGNDGTVLTGETRGTEVRATGSSTALATFMERTGANDIGVAASNWNFVMGSNTKAETVMLTDNEVGAANSLYLAGGKNVVDYSAMTASITANIGSVTRSVNTFQLQTTGIAGTGSDQIFQAANLDNANNYLQITGTQVSGDTVNAGALITVQVAPGTSGTPANRGTLSSVNFGTIGARHIVNLATNEVREDIHGQYADVNVVVRSANFLTAISGFENATNATGADRVSLIGNGGINGLTGGGLADILLGGRGIAPVGSLTTGDSLSGGAGADWYVYTEEGESPNGSVTGNNQSDLVFGAGAAGDAAVLRAQDTIPAGQFVVGTDKLVFTINADSWNVTRVTTPIPASLAAVVGAVAAAVTPGAVGVAGSATVTLPVDTTNPLLYARDQEFRIITTGSTPVDGDLIFRVQATGGGDIVDAAFGQATTNLNNAAAADDFLAGYFVYTDKTQSQGGGIDQILNFRSGQDKVDLSFLRATEWEARFGTSYDVNANNVADAVENFRNISTLPSVAINADLPNMFKDIGGEFRALAVVFDTTVNQEKTVVFIDVDHDGNYIVGNDMVISLVGLSTVAFTDFIFDQYDLLGVNNEIPGFAANATPGT